VQVMSDAVRAALKLQKHRFHGALGFGKGCSMQGRKKVHGSGKMVRQLHQTSGAKFL
jgi:hypothetical protein